MPSIFCCVPRGRSPPRTCAATSATSRCRESMAVTRYTPSASLASGTWLRPHPLAAVGLRCGGAPTRRSARRRVGADEALLSIAARLEVEAPRRGMRPPLPCGLGRTQPCATRRRRMLQLRPNCECCNRDLPPESQDAVICSFECTFCRSCADALLNGRCPNCGGELVTRPRRPAEKLAKYPASPDRVYKPGGCGRGS